MYFAQIKGRFYAVDAPTGEILWRKRFLNYCAAASPAVHRGIVYQPFHPAPCNYGPRNRPGLLVAMDGKTGRIIWRLRLGASESSPLIVNGVLYLGSWNRRLYAIELASRRFIWTFEGDGELNSAPAYVSGKIYISSYNGSVYALDARRGRVVWRARSFSRFGRREHFYATPALAYGRVFVGNTDGYVYAYGATTGRLLWAQRAGTYVYTAAAVWRRTVYVGTFDGYVVAFDAATGQERWRYDAPGSMIGAPTVMGGLVYFSICATCGRNASRPVEFGKPGTFALDVRTGRRVWTFPDGKYSPIVADRERVYLVGRTRLYGLRSKNTVTR